MSKKPTASTSPELKIHFLRDLSLEMTRPPLQKPQKGEQELQFALSVHQSASQNPGVYEVILASRLVIWHTPTRQPLTVADHAYSGVFHAPEASGKPLSAEQMQLCLEILYPLASESLKQHLAQVGHTPPLPKSVDFKEIINKP